ncbi:hypothetical protein H5410_044405 [Solanum commersonii]|uniref:Uncharacterized protein n=1 Tax=Solanum commersonii TaxID=4109 RepID=A0A9J5X6Y2_SOLCO|nr:hypothetical protein H5410_044405 [Solanum commersonii]
MLAWQSHGLITNSARMFSIGNNLAVDARGRMETVDTTTSITAVYMTRASTYKDALKGFIVGYQEGIQQVMEKKRGR